MVQVQSFPGSFVQGGQRQSLLDMLAGLLVVWARALAWDHEQVPGQLEGKTRGAHELPEGHRHLYEDDSVVLRREHDSGDFTFAATQVRDTHTALTSVHRAEVAKSQTKLRKLSAEDMLSMLGPCLAPNSKTDADEPEEDIPVNSDDDEECQDEDTDFRMLTLMGGAKPRSAGGGGNPGNAGGSLRSGSSAGGGGGAVGGVESKRKS